MENKYTLNKFQITEEMIVRGLEFFDQTLVSSSAPETTHPEFVLDLLNFALFGIAPWPVSDSDLNIGTPLDGIEEDE